jgi:hypothetical protein
VAVAVGPDAAGQRRAQTADAVGAEDVSDAVGGESEVREVEREHRDDEAAEAVHEVARRKHPEGARKGAKGLAGGAVHDGSNGLQLRGLNREEAGRRRGRGERREATGREISAC